MSNPKDTVDSYPEASPAAIDILMAQANVLAAYGFYIAASQKLNEAIQLRRNEQPGYRCHGR